MSSGKGTGGGSSGVPELVNEISRRGLEGALSVTEKLLRAEAPSERELGAGILRALASSRVEEERAAGVSYDYFGSSNARATRTCSRPRPLDSGMRQGSERSTRSFASASTRTKRSGGQSP
jgi:hypothetical protein